MLEHRVIQLKVNLLSLLHKMNDESARKQESARLLHVCLSTVAFLSVGSSGA